jgi:small subunit ribosomal protein S16
MRGGTKRKPYYKIVVAESTSPRDGRFVEIVGRYHPLNKEAPVAIEPERVRYWLANGVQPTKVVSDILRKQGVKQA